ncbi:MAG: hypothetical protein OXC29_16365, partial [Rhodococcus sp.]|nr:hypothetical protein [Rhodococcus sp. (in: high G+C Gram-positive bacteria)]
MNKQAMQPPANQPIGFWTARAGEAIRTRTRGALEAIGVTQPGWWVLHQLSLHPEGVERAVLLRTIGPNESTDVLEARISRAKTGLSFARLMRASSSSIAPRGYSRCCRKSGCRESPKRSLSPPSLCCS